MVPIEHAIALSGILFTIGTVGAIAREKAGIFRAGRPVVCAEPDPPASLTGHARAVGAPVTQIGRTEPRPLRRRHSTREQET